MVIKATDNTQKTIKKNNNRHLFHFSTFWFFFQKLNCTKNTRILHTLWDIPYKKMYLKKITTNIIRTPICNQKSSEKFKKMYKMSTQVIFWQLNVTFYTFFGVTINTYESVEFLISSNLEIFYNYDLLALNYYTYKLIDQNTTDCMLKLFFIFDLFFKILKKLSFGYLKFFEKTLNVNSFLFYTNARTLLKYYAGFIFNNLNHFLHSFKEGSVLPVFFTFFIINCTNILFRNYPLDECCVKSICTSKKIFYIIIYNFNKISSKFRLPYNHINEFGMNFL